MCDSIYNAATGQEIETPSQLRQLVGATLCPPCEEPEDEDCCLCDYNLMGILVAAGIDFESDDLTCFTISVPA